MLFTSICFSRKSEIKIETEFYKIPESNKRDIGKSHKMNIWITAQFLEWTPDAMHQKMVKVFRSKEVVDW